MTVRAPSAFSAIDDLGEARAWPRPLAHARQRGVVDVDDAHRQCRVDLPRRQIQIGVEHGQAQPRHRLGVGDAQRHGQEQQRRREQDVERERAQGVLPLVSGAGRAAAAIITSERLPGPLARRHLVTSASQSAQRAASLAAPSSMMRK